MQLQEQAHGTAPPIASYYRWGTEAQKDGVTYSRPHRWGATEERFEAMWSDTTSFTSILPMKHTFPESKTKERAAL